MLRRLSLILFSVCPSPSFSILHRSAPLLCLLPENSLSPLHQHYATTETCHIIGLHAVGAVQCTETYAEAVRSASRIARYSAQCDAAPVHGNYWPRKMKPATQRTRLCAPCLCARAHGLKKIHGGSRLFPRFLATHCHFSRCTAGPLEPHSQMLQR